jgi:hypothetical protein
MNGQATFFPMIDVMVRLVLRLCRDGRESTTFNSDPVHDSPVTLVVIAGEVPGGTIIPERN